MGKAFARAIFVLLFSVHEVSGASILKCWNRTLHWLTDIGTFEIRLLQVCPEQRRELVK